MHCFFVRSGEVTGDQILLTGGEAHHIRTVLRLQHGSIIELFDGTGTIYRAEIQHLGLDGIQCRIVKKSTEQTNDSFPITLAQAVLKGKKMDVVVQKATELGVTTLIPVLSRYSEPGSNISRRIQRWQRLMLEACKQSGRPVPMRISSAKALAEIPIASFPYPVFCWEKETQTLPAPGHLSIPGSILVLIGPEGGFDTEEVEWAMNNNCQIITLGPNILRAETAALAAVSIMKYLGDLTTLGVGNK